MLIPIGASLYEASSSYEKELSRFHHDVYDCFYRKIWENEHTGQITKGKKDNNKTELNCQEELLWDVALDTSP